MTDAVIHFLLVGFSAVVLAISLSAFAARRETRYLFLSFAFSFLAFTEVESLVETVLLSSELIQVPIVGIHLSHLFEFLMLASFVVSLAVGPRESLGDRARQ